MRVLLFKTLPANAGPDIGLGYLATALRRAGHDVRIDDLDYDESRGIQLTVTQRVRQFEADWVGCKVFDHSVGRSRSYLAEARRARPGIRTCVGGPHVSGFRERVVDSIPEADYPIAGEAERALPKLIEVVESGGDLSQVPGLVRRTADGVVVGHQDFPPDLDALGLPAWDLLDPRGHIEHYKSEPWLDRPIPYVPIVTTRGCPFPCTFCAAPVTTGKKLRHHSVKFVVDEIELLRDQYGVHFFSIADDAFTNEPEHVEEFCETLIRRKVRSRWDAVSNGIRCDTVTPKLARLLDEAGCEKVGFGIETGSPRIVQAMRKNFTHEQVLHAIQTFREHSKVKLEGYFIIGYPEERYSDAFQTLRFLRGVDLDTAWMFGFSPHVGTHVAGMLRDESSDEIRWGEFANDRIMYGTKFMPRVAVKIYYVLAWLTFYLRPTRFLRLFRELGVPAALRGISRFWLVLFPAARPPAPGAEASQPALAGV